MRRHIANPLNTGGLEPHIGIKPTSNGAVDDGLPLFLQQPDEPLLGTDVTANTPVGMVKVADDGSLFSEWWKRK